MNETRSSDALVGFLFGAVVGAGLALMMAPATGEETRRKIAETARRLGHDAQGKVDAVKDRFRRGAEEVREAVDAGREAYRQERTPV